MFWTFKLSFSEDIMTFLATLTLAKNWVTFYSIFWSYCQLQKDQLVKKSNTTSCFLTDFLVNMLAASEQLPAIISFSIEATHFGL